jgi:hypothetical protein
MRLDKPTAKGNIFKNSKLTKHTTSKWKHNRQSGTDNFCNFKEGHSPFYNVPCLEMETVLILNRK